MQASGKFQGGIVTEIIPTSKFYVAEDYHQDYYQKSPIRYELYRAGSGREAYLKSTWNDTTKNNDNKIEKSSDEELKNKLTPLQYQVTQSCGTEKAFDNQYWDNKKEGIYVDIVSGEPLFSSLDKFDSGTGWPSFTKPLEPDNILEKEDIGLRYCMNSAALRFIPKEDLEKEGYGKYKKFFEQKVESSTRKRNIGRIFN